MREPVKINGWSGREGKIFPTEDEARLSLAREDLEELLRDFTTNNRSKSWDNMQTWLFQNWYRLKPLMEALEAYTHPDPSEDRED